MMPFRLPISVEDRLVQGRDPTEPELATYLDWLRRELVTAEAAFDAMTNESRRPQGEYARLPLATHRVALIQFLDTNGASTRKQILAGTHIPPGSLSALLKEFVQDGRGKWKLRMAT